MAVRKLLDCVAFAIACTFVLAISTLVALAGISVVLLVVAAPLALPVLAVVAIGRILGWW